VLVTETDERDDGEFVRAHDEEGIDERGRRDRDAAVHSDPWLGARGSQQHLEQHAAVKAQAMQLGIEVGVAQVDTARPSGRRHSRPSTRVARAAIESSSPSRASTACPVGCA